jgi:general secretion pathway protein G
MVKFMRSMRLMRFMRTQGFTVIELLVVLAAMAVLLAIATPRYIAHLDQSREVVLRHNLKALREAIEQFQSDKGRPPTGLQELVTARYLRELPEDPITQTRQSWQWEALPTDAAPGALGVRPNVRSGAPGRALDGSPYASW